MKHLYLIPVAIFLSWSCASVSPTEESHDAPTVLATDLRCEYLVDPLGLDVERPRLSWKLSAVDPTVRGLRQTGYRILVASSSEILSRDEGDLWDSGLVRSRSTTHVEWKGPRLRSRAECHWKVRVWTADGGGSAWSAPARWTLGLLDASDWSARWIGAASPGASAEGFPPEPWLRSTFSLDGVPKQAFAYVASIGYHELYVNGVRVGDSVLAPAVSDLSRRVRYVTHDLTGHLHAGRNTLALWLGGGWSRFPTFEVENGPLVLAQVEMTWPDGSTTRVVTDGSWKVHESHRTLLGAWRFGQFGGERVDARNAMPGWNRSDLDDSTWQKATVYSPNLHVTAEKIEPNRRMRTIVPKGIEQLADDAWRIDMGRGFTGWIEIPLRGAPGSTATLTISEREDQEITYDQRHEYVFNDTGTGVFRNRFNYFSGRWITVRGVSNAPTVGDVRGYLVRTSFPRTGTFSCSDKLLERIYETILWTYESLCLGGFVVDCPHRERRGYGGDAHATMETALMSYDHGAFYGKWLEDWRDVQGEDGNIPYTAPTHLGGGGPAWSGVCISLPWEVYLAYGDRRILVDNYPMMKRWLTFLETKSQDGILHRYGHENWGFLGDWVPPGRQQGRGERVDDRSTLFFNNCYRFQSIARVAEIAAILGHEGDAAEYRRQAEALRVRVNAEFLDQENATYVNGEQPYLALALLTGLAPDSLRPRVMKNLVGDILVERKGHINSGIHGTYYLLKWLTEAGRSDLVYTMATKRSYPSWGHMLDQGATTIWEQWDGIHSRCHSSFLSLGAWFMKGLAGLRADPGHPGFSRFHIRPAAVGDLTWVKASYDSIHGPIAVEWRIDSGEFQLAVEVPPNTTALVSVPCGRSREVEESGRVAEQAPSVELVESTGDASIFEVGSGSYSFVCPFPAARDRSPAPGAVRDPSS